VRGKRNVNGEAPITFGIQQFKAIKIPLETLKKIILHKILPLTNAVVPATHLYTDFAQASKNF